MAKKKRAGGPNKSQAIRDYLAQHPGANPKQIVADLAKQGMKVSLGLANVVKYSKRGSDSLGRDGRRRQAARTATVKLTVSQLLAVKQTADVVGGPQNLRSALDVLDRLTAK